MQPSESKRHSVIIVDSDELRASHLTQTFSDIHVRAHRAMTFETVQSLLKNDMNQIVIINAELENGNGYAICKKIKTDFGDTPVFITSASPNATNDFAKHAKLKHKADAYFPHPLDEFDLFDAALECDLEPQSQPVRPPEKALEDQGEVSQVVAEVERLRGLEKEQAALQSELNQQRQHGQELQDKIAQLTRELASKATFETKVKELEDSIKSYESTIADLQDKLNKNAGNTKTLEDNLVQAEQRATEAEAEVHGLKEQHKLAVAKLREFYQKKIQDIEGNKDEVAALQNKLAELNEILLSRDKQISELESELEELRSFKKRINDALHKG